MKGNCAMNGRFAFNAEVNIAKGGQLCQERQCRHKERPEGFFIKPRHAAPGTALQTCRVVHL